MELIAGQEKRLRQLDKQEWYRYSMYFAADFGKDKQISKVTRSAVRVAYPFKPWTSAEFTDRVEMVSVLQGYHYELYQWLEERQAKSDLKAYPFSILLFNEVFTRQVYTDAAYAVFSALSVFGMIAFHTGSLFIAFAGVSSVFLSFPITIVLYSAA